MVRRIKDISELQESGFGQPWPRHGLKLLYWFADECISDAWNDDMILLCDPTGGDFGFHFFSNRCNRPSVKLLPDVKFHYYVVGNLNSPGAYMLPDYVREDNTRRIEDNSNADRIIVCYPGENKFGKVYVTTHKDKSNYDPSATFHITRTLIWLIKAYESINDFLRDTRYRTPNQIVPTSNPVSPVWYYNPELCLWVPKLNQRASPLPLENYDSEISIDVEPTSTFYNSDVSVNIENDTETQKHSETLPRKKRCCERFCTIL
ncbi:uncharacterized protein wu:fc75a09 [Triplophysa dalaica]|uniref:uncharacterized protein wu:fc75a09 n=1 Tax=Triplophysa dalaica TaxID=1582913 RepID=UPI0024DFF145|nr:uncharacterized protein wu:fc75a09 [Triplophysa dalaica]